MDKELEVRKQELELEMAKVARKIRSLQGAIGGHKAYYNKLQDELVEMIQKEKGMNQ